MNQIALIVHTCDRYRLLYTGFEYFFKKHFPYGDLPLSYYFLTEDADHTSGIFTNIKTGKGEWSDRLKNGLQQITEPYIIYFQEDMWLDRTVAADTLKQVFDFVLSNHISLLKLSSNSVYQTTPTGKQINGLAVTLLNNEKSGYLMSHQVSVWDKGFLISQLGFKEHPWRNERKGTQRLKRLNPLIYHIDLLSENGQQPVNDNERTAKMGSYYTVSQNAQLNAFALPFINQMKNSAIADIKSYADKLQYNLGHQITHDGLTRPRKEDLFKKIKNLFIK